MADPEGGEIQQRRPQVFRSIEIGGVMSPFYIGLLAGIFVGTVLGYIICALMVMAKGN